MSWIKVRTDLADDPHVIRLAILLRCPAPAAMGYFVALWCIADAHSEDGSLDGWDTEMLDARLGVPGFVDAVLKGSDGKGKDPWLVRDADGNLIIPKFDRHMSECAKRRAIDSKRQTIKRASSASEMRMSEKCPSPLGQNSDQIREEKRREEKTRENKPPHTPPQGGAVPAKPRRHRNASPEPPTFAAWYAAYPKRAARPNAARAYADAMASLAARIPDESARAAFLLDRAAAYAKSDIGRGDRRFIALPATWLNAARFDDDPAAWRNGNGTTHPTAPPDPAVQDAIARRRAEVKSAAEAERVRQAAYVVPSSTPSDKPIHDRPKLRIAQGGS